MPSIGASMTVWLRLTCDWLTAASDCVTPASACVTVACCDCSGARRVDGDFRRIEFALRQQLLLRERQRAIVFLLRVDQLHTPLFEITVRLGEVRARLRQVGALLLQLRLEQRRIETGDDLALLD